MLSEETCALAHCSVGVAIDFGICGVNSEYIKYNSTEHTNNAHAFRQSFTVVLIIYTFIRRGSSLQFFRRYFESVNETGRRFDILIYCGVRPSVRIYLL